MSSRSSTPSPIAASPSWSDKCRAGYQADASEGTVSPQDVFSPTVLPCGLTPHPIWPPPPAPLVPAFRQPMCDAYQDCPPAPPNEPTRAACLAPIDAMLVLPSRDLHATTYLWSSGRALFMSTTMQVDPTVCPDFDEMAYKPALEYATR